MSGTWSRAAFAMLGAMVILMVPAANAGAGPSLGPEVGVRIESPSQKEILARGLEIRVSIKGGGKPIVKVRGYSKTYDVPDFTRLTKTRAVRLWGAKASAPNQRVKVLRLRLTAAGREQIASCEARTLRVEAAHASDQAKLVRDTRRCKPKPVDLRRADRCDFIGQEDGSLCLLPFPDDYYTVADPSTRTGRRIDLKTAAMPRNVAGKPIDASPYNQNDGFSPGQAIVLRVPGLDNPEALAHTESGADRPHRPLRRAPCPDRPDRCPYRRARPDLRRDRLERDRAAGHRAHDPTGDQPDVRPPLHRRTA